ncbi:DUF2993 domain-containing protein [Streptomyces sp. NPDC048291]|uniref:LmeA family phospholipid-binding protein n=1 Tax=Streptomyces sp. NPDC048291 TaxID=3365530 RepID=UPI0037244F37
MRRRTTIAIAVTGLALAVTAVTAEIVVRHSLEQRITGAAQAQLGGDPSVDIGTAPALVDAMTGSISTVTINDPGYTTCKQGQLGLSLSLFQVTNSGQQVHVQESNASITLPAEGTASRIDAKLGGRGNASVTADPGQNALVISIAGGLLTFQESPTLNGSQIQLTPGDVTFEGAPAPARLTHRIENAGASSYQIPQLPLGLSVKSVGVSNDGLVLNASGGAAALGKSSGSGAAGGQAKACASASTSSSL